MSLGNDHQWLSGDKADLPHLLIEIYTTTSQTDLHNTTKKNLNLIKFLYLLVYRKYKYHGDAFSKFQTVDRAAG